MNMDVILTCAVTGAGDTTGKSHHVPVTPDNKPWDGIAYGDSKFVAVCADSPNIMYSFG